jgi:hypothetical protein
MLAHEIGHMVQERAMGLSFADLDTDSPAQALCRCDHYDLSWGNRKHCLQSREEQGGAQQQGFAHAFAVRVLNRTEEFNATMPYYDLFNIYKRACATSSCSSSHVVGWSKLLSTARAYYGGSGSIRGTLGSGTWA